MIAVIQLPVPLREQLRDEALRAFPRECCGLVEGTRDGMTIRVLALHATPNIAKESDRFEIDPAVHIALLRNLRGTGREIIGCYHSHPNGRAELSERDRESAIEPGFLWLITAIDAEKRTASVTAFVCSAQGFSPMPIVHEPGTAGACGPT